MKHWLPFLLPKTPIKHAVVALVALVFLGHALLLWRIAHLERLDAWIYDARLATKVPIAVHPDVVIIDVDEPSLEAFGRWPWSRATMTALVQRLVHDQRVTAIGFDMVFAEAESPSSDLAFATALEGQPVVLGYYFTSDRAGHTSGTLPRSVFTPFTSKELDFNIHNWSGFGGNLAALTQAAGQAGFFNAVTDTDGVIRAAPLLTEYKGGYYESLALALYRRYLAKRYSDGILPSITPSLATDLLPEDVNYRHVSHLQLTGTHWTRDIEVDDSVAMLVPYRGKGGPQAGSFQYISAKDILQGKLAPTVLKNKIVLIGSSAPALEDIRVTPVGAAYPGVEVQASLIAGLLDERTANKPDFSRGFDVLQLCVLSLILIFVLPRLSALSAVLLSALLCATLWFLHCWLHETVGWVLPSAASLALVFCAYLAHSSLGFFLEGRRRKHLTDLFGSYVSPRWVSRMVRSDNSYSMQASNQVLTVMFCDMRGFTKLANQLAPLALQALLNDIFSRLSKVIQEHGGTIDKYMGDCVMAFWGAPEPQADHAARAVRCALALQTAVRAYNQDNGSNMPPIDMGIGLNTGLMCVGDMGSSVRRSYTVIGDAVNVASRLEGLCKTFNVPLIISAATKAAAQTSEDTGIPATWLHLGSATIEGSDISIPIYTL